MNYTATRGQQGRHWASCGEASCWHADGGLLAAATGSACATHFPSSLMPSRSIQCPPWHHFSASQFCIFVGHRLIVLSWRSHFDPFLQADPGLPHSSPQQNFYFSYHVCQLGHSSLFPYGLAVCSPSTSRSQTARYSMNCRWRLEQLYHRVPNLPLAGRRRYSVAQLSEFRRQL